MTIKMSVKIADIIVAIVAVLVVTMVYSFFSACFGVYRPTQEFFTHHPLP